MRKSMFSLFALFLTVPLLFFGCGGGSDGAAGVSAPTTGTISGTVQDSTGAPLAGVEVYATSTPSGTPMATVFTDAAGSYSITAPIGGCYIYFEMAGYTAPGGMYVGVGGGRTTSVSATLSAINDGPSVTIAAVAGDNFGFESIVTLAASGNDPNGDPLSYAWTNATSPVIGAVAADPADSTGRTGKVTLPTMTQAFSRRTVSNGADISGYTIPARFGVMPIFPDTRGTVSARVTVNDGRGKTATATLALNAASIVPGLRTVPLNTRIYMNRGNDNAAQTWTLAKPAGSNAALDNDTRRSPSFVPDVAGAYTLTAGASSLVLYAGTWEGVITGAVGIDDFTVQTSCTTCHNGGSPAPYAPDKFTPWKGTNHAKIYTLNLTTDRDAEGKTCQYCHTVGYDAGMSNGGFDDAASAYDPNWLPPAPSSTSWSNLFSTPGTAAIAKLANIQCENCHGPQNALGHMKSDVAQENVFGSPRISFSAEVCAQCHGRTSHNYYSQWASSAHATRGHGTGTGCSRCHGAQGFTVFLSLLAQNPPNVGEINNLQAARQVPISSVTSNLAEGITCTACHDPHDKTNPNQLRVYDNVRKTVAGFGVTGFGKGAICVPCHSEGRSGTLDNVTTFLHEDAATGGLDPQTTSPPHASAITDTLVGRNAYFMGSSLPMGSKHLAVEDTCVGCHMALNPKKRGTAPNLISKSHLFGIEAADAPALCANCHGAAVDGEGIIAATQAGLDALQAKMGADMLAKLNGLGATVVNITGSGYNDNVAGSSFTSAAFIPDLGTSRPPGINFSLVYGSTTRTVALDKITVGGARVFPNSSNMMKAIWNYGMVYVGAGGGKAIHNPSFTQAVLNNTRAQNLGN